MNIYFVFLKNSSCMIYLLIKKKELVYQSTHDVPLPWGPGIQSIKHVRLNHIVSSSVSVPNWVSLMRIGFRLVQFIKKISKYFFSYKNLYIKRWMRIIIVNIWNFYLGYNLGQAHSQRGGWSPSEKLKKVFPK